MAYLARQLVKPGQDVQIFMAGGLAFAKAFLQNVGVVIQRLFAQRRYE